MDDNSRIAITIDVALGNFQIARLYICRITPILKQKIKKYILRIIRYDLNKYFLISVNKKVLDKFQHCLPLTTVLDGRMSKGSEIKK